MDFKTYCVKAKLLPLTPTTLISLSFKTHHVKARLYYGNPYQNI